MKISLFPLIGWLLCIEGAAAQTTSNNSVSDTATVYQCLTEADLPYHFSFENGLEDWQQSTNDHTDWTLQQGPTPSPNTGPEAAFNGNTYAYVEATHFPNSIAYLVSPCFILPAGSNISFAYNLYGIQMGMLRLQVSVNDGASWTTVWQKSANVSPVWKITSVSLAAYAGATVRLRFVGKTAGEASDMAIDNVSIGKPASVTDEGKTD